MAKSITEVNTTDPSRITIMAMASRNSAFGASNHGVTLRLAAGLNINYYKGKEELPMNKLVKKVLVGAMAATMMLGSVTTAFAAGSPTEAKEPVKQEAVTSTSGATVNTNTKGQATVTSVKKTNSTEVRIGSVSVDGTKYAVTRIESKTFANAAKAEKVVLPNTLKSIGAEAFTGAKSLKTIVIKSKTTVKVNKDAFKNVDTKKMTIKVTQNMSLAQYKAFKKQLRAAGFKGTIKRVTVGK